MVTDCDLAVRLVAEQQAGGISVARVMSAFSNFLTPQCDLRAAGVALGSNELAFRWTRAGL
jgi:hypothetical protein